MIAKDLLGLSYTSQPPPDDLFMPLVHHGNMMVLQYETYLISRAPNTLKLSTRHSLYIHHVPWDWKYLKFYGLTFCVLHQNVH